jgi:TetR/AcrR family transcriptional regulator, acrAB operon repressor
MRGVQVAFNNEPDERPKTRRILDAAASVFAKRGFNEARMDDVATEAGVSKGGLYLHFKSKDDLFDAIVGHVVSRQSSRLVRAKNEAGPVSARLLSYFDGYIDDLMSMERLYPVILEVYARAARHESLRRMLLRYVDTALPDLSALVAEGIASGEFSDADPDEVALQLYSLLEGLALFWALAPDRLPMPETAARAVRRFIAGMTVKPTGDLGEGGSS